MDDDQKSFYGVEKRDDTGSQTMLNPVSTAIPPQGPDGSITWTASEFIQHQKGPIWYAVLIIGSIIFSFLVWLVTKDLITASAIIIAMIMLAIWASKKPRDLEYRIDREGLHINNKILSFNDFKSFAVDHNGAFSSLVFFPLKRFSLLVTAYYDPADEQKILDILSMYLPKQDKKRDYIDELMWKIRF